MEAHHGIGARQLGLGVARGQAEEGDLAALPVVEHHLGGGVEVRLAALQQLARRRGQLRQEVLRIAPELDLVCAPL